MFAVEFVTDKVAYVDSAWNSVHTFVRPAIGAWIGALYAGDNGRRPTRRSERSARAARRWPATPSRQAFGSSSTRSPSPSPTSPSASPRTAWSPPLSLSSSPTRWSPSRSPRPCSPPGSSCSILLYRRLLAGIRRMRWKRAVGPGAARLPAGETKEEEGDPVITNLISARSKVGRRGRQTCRWDSDRGGGSRPGRHCLGRHHLRQQLCGWSSARCPPVIFSSAGCISSKPACSRPLGRRIVFRVRSGADERIRGHSRSRRGVAVGSRSRRGAGREADATTQ